MSDLDLDAVFHELEVEANSSSLLPTEPISEYTNDTLYDLNYRLYNAKDDVCQKIDPFLAAKIIDMSDINAIHYGLRNGLPDNMPNTRKRLSSIVTDYYKAAQHVDSYRMRDLCRWLDLPTKRVIMNEWFTNTYVHYQPYETIMREVFEQDPTYQIPVINKLVTTYKQSKYQYHTRTVAELFKVVSAENLTAVCDIIATSTPLMQTAFLLRGDLDERYILKGVKALSKLSTQKDIEAKIDFKLLEKLGPIGRLNAMQNLLGMLDGYYKLFLYYKKRYGVDEYYTHRAKNNYMQYGKHNLPFKEIPTCEDMARFLFPCSIKYNDRVTLMMERYNDLITQMNLQKTEEVVSDIKLDQTTKELV